METGLQNKTKEAEKVEESLRDFIGRIIGYYEEYGLPGEVLDRYERIISDAETLLEVFDIMKEMFEELMRSLREKIGSSSSKSKHHEHEEDSCAPGEFEQVLQAYEAELVAHTKTQESTQMLIDRLHEDLKSSKSQIQALQAKIQELSQPNPIIETRRFSSQNTKLYSTAVSFGENNQPISRQLSGHRLKNFDTGSVDDTSRRQTSRGKNHSSKSPKRLAKANSQARLRPRNLEQGWDELGGKSSPMVTTSLLAGISQGMGSNHSRTQSREQPMLSWAPGSAAAVPPKLTGQFGQLLRQQRTKPPTGAKQKLPAGLPKPLNGLAARLLGKIGAPSLRPGSSNITSARCGATAPVSLGSSGLLRSRPVAFP